VFEKPKIKKKAMISSDGIYRYSLERIWGDPLIYGDFCQWIMLNPSIADDKIDDPTIRRCVSFAKSWGCDRIRVLNLFAFRSASPKEMKSSTDPIGPKNNYLLETFCQTNMSKMTVLAWGNHGDWMGRDKEVSRMFPNAWCLGKTKQNQPRHPLYVKKSVVPERFF